MKSLFTLFILISSISVSAQQQSVLPDDLYENLPFPMEKIKLPTFPNNTVNIKDFGAKDDGNTLCTEAFAKAIDALAAKNGGKLIVPRGLWLTGPIVLKSNINLHIERGGVIIFSPDFSLYPLIETSFEGFDTRRCQSPLSAKEAENIAITGEGVIDGSGEAWRPVKKEKMTDRQWKELLASGGVLNDKRNIWWPTASALHGSLDVIDQNVPKARDEAGWLAIKDFLRPVMVSLVSCKNVWLDGVTFQNSPAWNIHPLMCENLVISNLTVRNPWYSQNGDGLDVESCKNVVVYNSNFDVGDDAICIKSGKNEDGRRRAMPTENLIVKGCVVYHGHGGFVVGSEMSGGVRNVKVSECTFMGTDVGLRFKSTRGRGGIVENIWISDINMTNIPAEPLLFDLFYGGKSAIEAKEDEAAGLSVKSTLSMPIDETTPQFRNINIKNIVCKGAGRAMYFNGLPEMNVKNVSLENVYIQADTGAVISETDGITIKNVTIVPKIGDPIIFKNTKNINEQ
ncbi:MAG: glycoside hydrolase family 28 protein [Bacteroidales bacterium]|nr:glycoside hydrolase family 28 protein [Bacteroidales bacterium]MCL2133711.1 glycoside hydrolase family 28 protein [Bacteroidales bacterium]